MATMRPDGSIEFASLEELLRYQDLKNQRKTAAQSRTLIPPRQDNGTTPEMEFLRKLNTVVGRHLTSAEMLGIVGAKSEPGVGPKIANIGRRLKVQGVELDDYLGSKKTDRGTVIWIPKKAFA